MNDIENVKPVDKFVSVDGLKLRYIEAGSGPSVLFLHGASLGSSADVFNPLEVRVYISAPTT